MSDSTSTCGGNQTDSPSEESLLYHEKRATLMALFGEVAADDEAAAIFEAQERILPPNLRPTYLEQCTEVLNSAKLTRDKVWYSYF